MRRSKKTVYKNGGNAVFKVCSLLFDFEQLCLTDRATVLLSEGCWFSSPVLHVNVSLGKTLNPKLPLMCWLAPCLAATTISLCMNYCKSLWTKASARCH